MSKGRPVKWGSTSMVVLGLLLAFAVPAQPAPADFPRPAALEPQIEFWRRTFHEWSENQVAIHDNLYMDRVYAVVDLRAAAESGIGESALYALRKRRTDEEKKRIDDLLVRVHAKRGAPAKLDPEEKRIFDMFAGVPGDRRFLEARERVRAQQGLRERFKRGIEISRRYLPHMEEIFRREGLPLELTRMPFIESTFNVRAYSKVGAAGIWQFIPSSARIYGLRMNEVVDDRRDPLLATRAAARHLKDDYKRLGTWPLAVTAYNHGRGGIARAVATVGRPDLMEIIQKYRGRAFGFASRNFYASFLAALDVERDATKHFGTIRPEPKLEYDEVVVSDYVRFATAARLAGMEVAAFHEMNPAFERVVVDGKLYVPRGESLRIPAGRAAAFRGGYAKLDGGERFAQQRRYFIEHRVQSGQTVGAIARRYRTSVSAIQAANNLRSVNRIRIGQVLRIPTGGSDGRGGARRRVARHRVSSGDTVSGIAKRYGTSVKAILATNGLAATQTIHPGQELVIPAGTVRSAGRYVRHEVRRGQTVGGIARRYGTSVKAIQAANDLERVDRIRPGQVLKIPSG